MPQVNVDLTQVVVSVIGIMMTWILSKLSKWMDAKAEVIKQANKNDKLDKYVDIAKNTVLDAVKAINQSVVDDLKEKSADGKLTDAEKEDILWEAVENVLASLSDNLKGTLAAVYGDLPTWVKIQVENAVIQEKERKSDLVSITDLASQYGEILTEGYEEDTDVEADAQAEVTTGVVEESTDKVEEEAKG